MEKHHKIFDDIIDDFLSMGLPVNKSEQVDEFKIFSSEIKRGEVSFRILVLFDLYEETVVVSIALSHAVPPEKRKAVIELINLINYYLDTGHFTVCPETGIVMIKDGIFVVDDSLNKKEFNRFVKKIINDAHVFFPLINDQALSNKKPKEMMTNFLKENEHLWK